MVDSTHRKWFPPYKFSWYGMALTLVVLAGFALRLPLLDRFPFREDEAIYSYWALHGWYEDPLFLQVWPDKPPVFIWLLSLAFQVWGITPPAARFVGIVASTLSIPVVAATARRWWGASAGLVTGAFLAFNPFAISFAPTAYTDSTLLLLGALAICCVAHQRYFFAGLWLALAIMTKQQGLLFVPLAAALAWPDFRRRGSSSLPQVRATRELSTTHQHSRPLYSALVQFLAGTLLVLAPILYWDSLRWSVAPSPWDLGVQNIGGVGLAEPQAWLPRIFDWLPLASYLLGNAFLWASWILLVGGGLVAAVLLPPRQGVPLRVQILGGWLVCFALFHVLATVQIWDRYLLPLVLPLALIAGWAGSLWAESQRAQPASLAVADLAIGKDMRGLRNRRKATIIAAGILMLVAFPITLRAASGQLPVGADHGAYVGLDKALAWVTDHATEGTIVYHRTLGWQNRFYFYAPIRQGEIELRWYPNAVYLADNALKMPHRQRLIVTPSWSPDRDLELQLATRGLKAEQRFRSGAFIVYAIEATTKGSDGSGTAEPWRACRPPTAYSTRPFTFTLPDRSLP